MVGDPETLLLIVQKPKEEVAAAAVEGETKEPELIRKERAEDAEDEEKDKKAPAAEAKGAKPVAEDKEKKK